MPKQGRPLSSDEAGALVAILAVVFGGFIYLYQPATAGFPINDGGLFYAMIRAIQGQGFALPSFVDYNGLSIPFVYPPLGFYLAGLLSTLFHLDALLILQWLPAAVAIATAAAFYFVARQILGSSIEAGIATFLYVCTPRSATWLIMGGGITRGLGQLFLLLTLGAVHRMFTSGTRRALIASAAFGALVVLTHPEAALHTIALSALMWIILSRKWRGVKHGLLVAAAVIALSSVWWLTVLLRHGLGPLRSAGSTGLHNALAFFYPLFMLFTEEPAMTLVAVLAVVGFFRAVAARQWLIPAWILLPFLVDPRNAPTIAVIPVALLAARALHQVVLPAIAAAANGGRASGGYLRAGAAKAAVGYMEAFLLVMALYAGMQLARVRVSPEHRAAFEWIAANTPAGSRFLVVTGATELFCDPVQEWFPVLTERVSATTIQGNEWLGGNEFAAQMARVQQVQLCLRNADAATCLQDRAAAAGLDYDHIYVARSGPRTRGCRAEDEQRTGDALLAQLHSTAGYRTVYVSDAAEVLELTSPLPDG